MPARIILTIGYIIVNNTWGAYQPYNINYMYPFSPLIEISPVDIDFILSFKSFITKFPSKSMFIHFTNSFSLLFTIKIFLFSMTEYCLYKSIIFALFPVFI